ncbi:MAG TPA: MFS transporter, partial [Pseudomonadales bacterium]
GQLLMFDDQSLLSFAVGAAFFGFGMGGTVPMQGALIGRMFGRERFGKAMGSLRPAMFPLQIIGVPLAGWMFDQTGTYDPAFQLFLVLYVLAGLAALCFREMGRAEL